MFSLDLKNLLQLSQCKEGTCVRHKRIQCGKISYNICYELKNGYLIVQQAKRVKSAERKSTHIRRRLRQRRRQLMHPSGSNIVSNSTLVCESSIPSINSATVSTSNGSSQTEQLEQRQVAVDTTHLIFMISRHQQCIPASFYTTGSQTKRVSLEPRSTQMEHSIKTKITQTCTENSPASSQTVAAVLQVQDSSAQTTLEQDEQELLQPHIKLMNCILHSIRIQVQLLTDGIESINYLVSFKELELQRDQLQHAQKLNSTKVKQATIKRTLGRYKHHCKHCLQKRRENKRKPQPELAVGQTQTEALDTPTDCVCKQLRKFESKAMQTDKLKGFCFLRHY